MGKCLRCIAIEEKSKAKEVEYFEEPMPNTFIDGREYTQKKNVRQNRSNRNKSNTFRRGAG